MSNFIIKVKYALKNNSEVLKDAEIEVTDKNITYIGKKRSLKKENYEYLEFEHGLAVPGFINGHTHLPETLIRGICDDEDLHTWLYDHVWKIEPSMSPRHAKVGALLGIAEMIRSGTVAFIDQYFYSNQIAEVVAETGMKAFLAPSIFDGNPETKTIEKAFDKNKQVFRDWNGYDNRIFVGFGPHAPYSVSDEWFKEILEETRKYGTKIHTHVSETMREVKETKEKFNSTPVEYLNKIGALEYILAAHCIHLTEQDISLLQQNKTTILSNPQSNCKIGAGIAPIPNYVKIGLNVILGTDGSASNNNLDIMEEARLLALLHKGLRTDPKILPIKEIIPLFTSNGNKVFPNKAYIGVLKENSPADIVIFNLNSANMLPVINPISNWMFASNPSDIELTMANGKILFRKRDGKEEYFTLNIEQIKKQAQKAIDEMMSVSNYIP